VQDGSYLSIPACMHNELAQPELLHTVDLPFTKAQYHVCTDQQWMMHFDHFFPKTVENDKCQNFGRCTYYINYMALTHVITKASLTRTRCALRDQFNQLVWVPYTQSDHMWSTGKMNGSQWKVLPHGASGGGPVITINPACQRELITLRMFDWPKEGKEEGKEE